jgi:hypothetical protein
MDSNQKIVRLEADLPTITVELEDALSNQKQHRLRSGDLCPVCRIGYLDYDGLLNLSCPECGAMASGGCFT